jgi:hypothetical protein
MIQRTVERIRAEFVEMPGLRLTLKQVQRLFGVDETMSRAVLDALVRVKFLCLNADGTYARPSDAPSVRPHAAKADFRIRHAVRKAS